MNFNAAYGAMREHTTPIPTPPWVRLGSSILIGAAVALLASRAHIFAALVGALVCLVAAFVLVFAHPYRRAMRSYANKRNVALVPTIAQLVPLMILWAYGDARTHRGPARVGRRAGVARGLWAELFRLPPRGWHAPARVCLIYTTLFEVIHSFFGPRRVCGPGYPQNRP